MMNPITNVCKLIFQESPEFISYLLSVAPPLSALRHPFSTAEQPHPLPLSPATRYNCAAAYRPRQT